VLLPGSGPFKIATTTGSGVALPEDVAEAARRLAEYYAGLAGVDGSQVRAEVGAGPVKIVTERVVAAQARAMQLSGAGDLLRPWRSLGRAA